MGCKIIITKDTDEIVIPIQETESKQFVSAHSIEQIYDRLGYVKSNVEIVQNLYPRFEVQEMGLRDSDNINQTLREIFKSPEEFLPNISMYSSSDPTVLETVVIKDQYMLIVGGKEVVEFNKLALVDALMNIATNYGTAAEKLELFKMHREEGKDGVKISNYNTYLQELELAEDLYMTSFIKTKVLKYKTAITNRNVYYGKYFFEVNAAKLQEGDILKIDQKEYLYLGLTETSENNYCLLEIDDNVIGKTIILEKQLAEKYKIKRLKLNYDYFLSPAELATAPFQQDEFSPNIHGADYAQRRGDVVSFNGDYFVVADVFNISFEKEVLLFSPDTQTFQYVPIKDIELISVNKNNAQKSIYIQQDSFDARVTIEYNQNAYKYFKLIAPYDGVNLKENSDILYIVNRINPDGTIVVQENDKQTEGFVVRQEDIKTILFQSKIPVSQQIQLLQTPMKYVTKRDQENTFGLLFAYKRGYTIDEKTNNYVEELRDANIRHFVYDLGNYREIGFKPQENSETLLENRLKNLNDATRKIKDLNYLDVGDLISIQNGEEKIFFEISSKKSIVDNQIEVLKVYAVSTLQVGNKKVYVEQEINETFFSNFDATSIKFYSNDQAKIAQHSPIKSNYQEASPTLSVIDNRILDALSEKFNLPIKIIEDASKKDKHAWTDGSSIVINLAARPEGSTTYIAENAMHELIHLMLGNMRINSPEDYRVLLETSRKTGDNGINIVETEETIVLALMKEIGNLDNTSTWNDSTDIIYEFMQLINKGYKSLLNVELPSGNVWLHGSVAATMLKYGDTFFKTSTDNFRLSEIQQHNKYVQEIGKITKKCS